MTSTKLVLCTLLKDTGSRESGEQLRHLILENLNQFPCVELDFSQVTLTPSFADEAFGLLCTHLSKQDLNQKIKFQHLSATHKALLARVIGNRFK